MNISPSSIQGGVFLGLRSSKKFSVAHKWETEMKNNRRPVISN